VCSRPPRPKTEVTVDVGGRRVRLREAPRAGGAEEDTTGRLVWECANVVLRFVTTTTTTTTTTEAAGVESTLPGGQPPPGGAAVPPALPLPALSRGGLAPGVRPADLSWLDLSAGAGLLAAGLTALGARRVLAADTASALPLLRENVAAAAAAAGAPEPPPLAQFYWGDPLERLRPPWAAAAGAAAGGAGAAGGAAGASPPAAAWFDVALASDLPFIALGGTGLPPRAGELADSLAALAASGAARVVVLAYEERLVAEEGAFVAALAARPGVAVEEVTGAPARLDKEHRLRRARARGGGGGGADGGAPPPADDADGGDDGGVGDVFWEPPPVRLFLITRAAASG